jgi:hypothetical protein
MNRSNSLKTETLKTQSMPFSFQPEAANKEYD